IDNNLQAIHFFNSGIFVKFNIILSYLFDSFITHQNIIKLIQYVDYKPPPNNARTASLYGFSIVFNEIAITPFRGGLGTCGVPHSLRCIIFFLLCGPSQYIFTVLLQFSTITSDSLIAPAVQALAYPLSAAERILDPTSYIRRFPLCSIVLSVFIVKSRLPSLASSLPI